MAWDNASVHQQCTYHIGASKTEIIGSLLGAYTQAKDTVGANVLLYRNKKALAG